MGIDIHIHDYYFTAHLPAWLIVIVLAIAALLGAWKLVQFLWTA